jgi:hypothetical protein
MAGLIIVYSLLYIKHDLVKRKVLVTQSHRFDDF